MKRKNILSGLLEVAHGGGQKTIEAVKLYPWSLFRSAVKVRGDMRTRDATHHLPSTTRVSATLILSVIKIP